MKKLYSATTIMVLMGVALTACTAPVRPTVVPAATDITVEAPISVDPTSTPIPQLSPSIVPQQSAAGTPAVASLSVDAGRVEVRQATGSSYSIVRNTTPIGNGDVIRTGPDGTATINFLDDTETTVFPNTVLVIDAFNRQSDGSYTLQVIQLIGSTFNRANFSNNNSTQQIATPYGVASVRGTGYWVEVVIQGPLANTLLQQELEAFIAQAGLDGSLGNFSILVSEIIRLLGATPGTVSTDVGNGAVTFTDLSGSLVSVTAGFTATSGLSTDGSPIVVTVEVLDRFCGDNICDAYLGETGSTCTADC